MDDYMCYCKKCSCMSPVNNQLEVCVDCINHMHVDYIDFEELASPKQKSKIAIRFASSDDSVNGKDTFLIKYERYLWSIDIPLDNPEKYTIYHLGLFHNVDSVWKKAHHTDFVPSVIVEIVHKIIKEG